MPLTKLSDVPLNEDVKPEGKAFDACADFIKKHVGHNSVSSFAVVKKNGDNLIHRASAACHADWYHNYSYSGPPSKDKYAKGTLIGNAFNKFEGNKAREEFYDFFVKRSMWSRFILNKDDPETNHLGTIIDCSLPKSIVQSINIAGRIREWPLCCESWKFLVDNGFDPDLALLWMSQIGVMDDKGNVSFSVNKFPKEGKLFKNLAGHSWTQFWEYDSRKLKNLKDGVVNLGASSPSGLFAGYGTSSESVSKVYAKVMKDLAALKRGETSSPISNPFAPTPPPSNNYMTIEDFRDHFLPILKGAYE